MVKVYKKLVRDKIPMICRQEGETPNYYVLSHKRFSRELKKKLLEESEELFKAKPAELKNEIADVYEVLLNIAKNSGMAWVGIEKFRVAKNKKRGSFKKRYFLVSSKD